MKQQKVQRNVFIHYNVRLRLRNMDRATGQVAREPYNSINLDYIFTEPKDDPLLPWLEQREKDKDMTNSEEENYPELIKKTTQPPTFNLIEDSSDTISDHPSESNTDSSDDGGEPQIMEEFGVQSTSDTIVPSTYPQSSQSQHTTQDVGKVQSQKKKKKMRRKKMRKKITMSHKEWIQWKEHFYGLHVILMYMHNHITHNIQHSHMHLQLGQTHILIYLAIPRNMDMDKLATTMVKITMLMNLQGIHFGGNFSMI